MTVVIGLTGPIGCGKSSVAGWLGERPGVVVIDADLLARAVVEPGEPVLDAVIARFGEGLRRVDGTLDRAALGRIVFSDPAALAELEAFVHPAVRPRVLAALERAEANESEAVIIEAIKLVEGGLAAYCDEVWLVTCEPLAQLERVVGRGTGRVDAERRIAAQGDLAGRLRPSATRVIDTSAGREIVRRTAEVAFAAAIEQHRD